MSNLWTIIPVKSLIYGKSRLSPILTPAKRYKLNKFLLINTLKIAKNFSGKNILVVSGCDLALQIAKNNYVEVLIESPPFELNSALQQSVLWLRQKLINEFLILPYDLPYITANDLYYLQNKCDSFEEIIIATDYNRTGTNALYFNSKKNFNFKFGEGSLFSHLAQAKSLAINAKVLKHPRLALDIDTPTDYLELQNVLTKNN